MRNLQKKHGLYLDIKKVFFFAKNTLSFVLDFLFPASELDNKIHSLTYDDLSDHLSIKDIDSNTVSLFKYRDPLIKRMIWLLKYHKNEHTVDLFSNALGEYLTETMSDLRMFKNFNDPLLVPIPLSDKRKVERGFNQMESVSKSMLGNYDNLVIFETHALKKHKDTIPQTTLSKEKRMKNVDGSFTADENIVTDKNIILIDDVLTTGSTLKEAREVLIKAGAKNVLCVALAH